MAAGMRPPLKIAASRSTHRKPRASTLPILRFALLGLDARERPLGRFRDVNIRRLRQLGERAYDFCMSWGVALEVGVAYCDASVANQSPPLGTLYRAAAEALAKFLFR